MSNGAISPMQVAPSTPDPATVTLVMALLRHVLSLLSGAGLLGGLVINDGMLLTISSALVGIATIAWSLWQKYQAKKADHLASVMSADLHRPVEPK